MSQPALTWGEVERYCRRHGYEIKPSGEDKLIYPPKSPQSGLRPIVRVGHKYCGHAGNQLLPCYISAFKRKFGLTIQDIKNG